MGGFLSFSTAGTISLPFPFFSITFLFSRLTKGAFYLGGKRRFFSSNHPFLPRCLSLGSLSLLFYLLGESPAGHEACDLSFPCSALIAFPSFLASPFSLEWSLPRSGG